MKHVIALFAFVLAASAIPAQAQDSSAQPWPEGHPGIQVMLVQTAKESSFDGSTLTLKGLSPSTLFFADRPERMVGHLSNSDFVDHWAEGQDNFAADPPNAALSILSDSDEPQVAIVELLNPKLDGDNLSYEVKVLEGTVPETTGEVALFIDPWYWRPRRYWGPGPYWGPRPCHWSYYWRHRVCGW